MTRRPLPAPAILVLVSVLLLASGGCGIPGPAPREMPPGDATWDERVSFWLARADRAEEALADLEKAAESGDPHLVLLAGKAAEALDRPGKAAAWYRAHLAAHPRDREVAIALGKLLGTLGRPREALAVLEPLVGPDPRVLNLAGYSALLAGDRERARAYLARSIETARDLGRDYAPPHYHMGLLLHAEGREEEALEEFLAATRANPDHLEGWYQALGAAERLGRDDVAARARREFARLYEARLREQGAFEEPGSGEPPLERDTGVEWRPLLEELPAEVRFPAGSTLAFACLAPAGGKARFVVTAGGRTLLDVVHEGGAERGIFVPHEVTVPGGDGEVMVRFETRAAGFLAGFLRRPAPAGSGFSVPRVLADPARRSADPRPNVLLVSLDTARADRLGCYGNPRPVTPHLDALARDGVRFARAEAASNWTLPSHYSLFSGYTPAAHGVLPDLGAFHGYLHPDQRLNVRGSGRETMLAEALRERGFRTVAITENAWVSPRFGFSQGFDVYRYDGRHSLPGTAVAALAELSRNGSRGPWFLFVHTYAPHQPYHAPREFRLRFASPDHVGFAWPLALVPIGEYYRFHTRIFPAAPSDVRAFRDLYDGQLAWADTLVGQLLGELERQGLREQTLVVVTADHGEELLERGLLDHGDTLHEEVTRVPLVVAWPGRVPAGVVVEETVSGIDVAATILDLVGVGDRLGDGRSLVPCWTAAGCGERIAFAEAIGFGGEPLHAAWRGSVKYVVRKTAEGTREMLFDLRNDPGERRNLASRRAPDLARMRRVLREHLAAAAKVRGRLGVAEEQVDEETLERLRGLGYVQ